MDEEEKSNDGYGGSETDAELDSEVEDTDAEQELSVWLDQLNQIQQVGFKVTIIADLVGDYTKFSQVRVMNSMQTCNSVAFYFMKN